MSAPQPTMSIIAERDGRLLIDDVHTVVEATTPAEREANMRAWFASSISACTCGVSVIEFVRRASRFEDAASLVDEVRR